MKPKQPPVYLRISEDLKAMINAGAFEYDIPFCTEKSICEQYNVSRITAKHAIDELEQQGLLYRKRGVGSFVIDTKEKDNSYHFPSPQVIQKTIALMIPFSITRGGIFAAIESATTILSASGIYLTLHVYPPGCDNEENMLKTLYNNHADGVIYYPSTSTLPTEALDLYCKDGKPVIIIDKPNTCKQYSSVVCDNFSGGYMITSHILSYGHKNVCYLSRYYYDNMSSIEERYNGYLKAMKDYGCSNPRFVKIDIPEDANLDYPMLKHVVNTLYQEGMTALVCENDEVAFYVHMASRSLGLRPPEDLSITGFDNISWATTGSAQITTISQDFAAIGEAIAGILLQEEYKPLHIVVPVKLIPRNSTGPAYIK
ncbi:GntR family transcriptional regulator [Lachnospiraceae bacterium OttesenSCG-928-D06]|nr:GntR family transcriptional regulator [Lachnospiraceae bacterium OttesenSCG-928-D06]